MNILFVCTGNTCRSAMAEAAARRLIQEQPEQYGAFQVASAGVMCAGPSPASPQAVVVAQKNGCDLSQFTAKQITEPLMQEADYIFVMTRSHKMMLDAAMPQYSDKVFLLNAYAAGDPTAPEIPDPFGGSEEDYAQCFAVLQESIQAVFAKIKAANNL